MTVWREVQAGDRVAVQYGAGQVDSVEATPFAVIAHIDGALYILNPEEPIQLRTRPDAMTYQLIYEPIPWWGWLWAGAYGTSLVLLATVVVFWALRGGTSER
jgi:hypothetical protein